MGFWDTITDAASTVGKWYGNNKGWVDPVVTTGVGYYTAKQGEKAMEQSAEASDRAAELAYQRSLPWSTGGLFGAAAFDPKTRRALQTLSPELKAQYDQYLKQSKTHGAYIPQAQAEFARQRALAKAREGQFTKQLGYIPAERRRYEEQMGRVPGAEKEFEKQMGRAEGTEADYKAQMAKVAGAESDFAKQRAYAAKMEGDPIAAGKKFYEMQKAVYAPEQEKQRLALESRLLSQGMLGSTGGKARQEALLTAQGQQDLQAQADATKQAQQMIDKYRGRSAEEQRLADVYRRRGSEEQKRGDLYSNRAMQQQKLMDMYRGRGLQHQDLMDKYRQRASQEQAWAGMFRDRSKQEQALIDTYRARRASDLGMVESLGKLPQSYSALGQGIGQGMSGIAQSAAGMQQSAAQGMADASAAKWGGVASNVGKYLSPVTNTNTYNPDKYDLVRK